MRLLHHRSTIMAGVAVISMVFAFSPAAGQSSTKQASYVCRDGSTMVSPVSGACAGHRGVDSLATKAAKDAAKADKAERKAAKDKEEGKDAQTVAKDQAKAQAARTKADKAETKAARDSAGAIAKCKDGTFAHSATMSGACSGHGGVAKTLKP